MRFHLRGRCAAVALALAVLAWVSIPSWAQTGQARNGRAAAIAKAAEKQTPQMPDGHPNLNGYWRNSDEVPEDIHVGDTTYIFGTGRLRPLQAGEHQPDPNPPHYKPEFSAKVKDLSEHEGKDDPAFSCTPLGVPRIGPPSQIVQTGSLIVFLYQIDAGSGDGSFFRTIPVDGRPHRTDVDPMYFGDSVGRWENDTLVVDVTHLAVDTWLGMRGYFHSKALHVTERLTRKGDTLQYEAIAEDPQVLTEPWKMDPRTQLLSNDIVVEVPPCRDFDQGHLVNDDHH